MTKEEAVKTVDAVIEALVVDLTPVVKDIEARPETTQGHYGDYGALLADLGQGQSNRTKLLAVALVKAGANRFGVASGVRHFCGIEL